MTVVLDGSCPKCGRAVLLNDPFLMEGDRFYHQVCLMLVYQTRNNPDDHKLWCGAHPTYKGTLLEGKCDCKP